jgi:hypothetical protein
MTLPFVSRNVVAFPRLHICDSAQPFCSPDFSTGCSPDEEIACCRDDNTINIAKPADGTIIHARTDVRTSQAVGPVVSAEI